MCSRQHPFVQNATDARSTQNEHTMGKVCSSICPDVTSKNVLNGVVVIILP
jgi:hypothetical protein